MDALGRILDRIRKEAVTQHDKGVGFEKLIQAYLTHDPIQADQYEQVQSFSKWAQDQGLNRNDRGIDLVAKLKNEEGFAAIQCKFYAADTPIQKSEIDGFIAAATALNQHMKRMVFVHTSSRKWSDNAEETIKTLPFTRIDLHNLRDSLIDWGIFEIRDEIVVTQERRQIRPDQRENINKVKEGFAEHDRGKMIMACGTGKTFTSLKIAEEIEFPKPHPQPQTQPQGKNILFLVPSLALMSQVIREWILNKSVPMAAYSVCSDGEVGKSVINENDVAQMTKADLEIPVTTNAAKLAQDIARKRLAEPDKMITVFATYQSLDVIKSAQFNHNLAEFDLVICDEAHRTTGATLDNDESSFVKVHSNDHIKAKKRLYMTATPRIYTESAKKKVKNKFADRLGLISMDDRETYGETFVYRSFGWAVQEKRLTDYKVIVLVMDSQTVDAAVQNRLSNPDNSLNIDEATKLIGAYRAMAKLDYHQDNNFDPTPMKRVLAFNQSIADSKALKREFPPLIEEYREDLLRAEKSPPSLKCEIEHVDGSFGATERTKILNWLKEPTADNICRILSNARVLTEGVDIPALDGIIFVHPRKSKIDIVQAVGRVMRLAAGKKLGYVILPIAIPYGQEIDQALNQNENFEVIWGILNALRSHDERLDAKINALSLADDEDITSLIDIIVTPSDHRQTAAQFAATLSERIFDQAAQQNAPQNATQDATQPSPESIPLGDTPRLAAPETSSETSPETSPESHSEATLETRPKASPNTHPETSRDTTAETQTQPQTQTQTQPHSQSHSQTQPHSQSHSQTQPHSQTHSQPQAAPPKPVRSPRLIDKAIQKMPETAEISKVNFRRPKTLDITRPHDGDETGGVSGAITAPLFIIDKITLAIRAKIVAKCGTRQYEDAWIKNIQDITENLIGRLKTIIETKPHAKPAFAAFLAELQSNLNPAVTQQDAIDMLAQHIVTKPVFDSLFADFAFAKHNPVSQAIDKILILLDAHMLLTETKSLAEFYERVKIRTASATSPTAKQKIIISLYDDFFRNALPRQAKRLGIVYTPVEIVDFIIHSVNDVLRQEFGQSLGSPDVRILDPFTGTGTFVTRLLQSGLIPPDQLTAKYQSEIFANEILLLAYYIATINIETAYHDEINKPRHSPPPLGGRGIHYAAESTILGNDASEQQLKNPSPAALHASQLAHLNASSPAAVDFKSVRRPGQPERDGESGDPALLSPTQSPNKTQTKPVPYLPFNGICLTDTFQMNRPKKLEDGYLPGNSERIAAQEKSPIQVIIGNPPYSTGQTNANDNNANMDYPELNQRIAASYAKYSKATNKNGLYDSYILAFRWASDRIGKQGVIGFVTGSAWIERNFADGMRKCLKDEFSALYVFHTRGDGRKEMLSKGRAGEGQNIFGQATMTGIAISILVKNPNAAEQGKIYFYDIGDDLKTHEKIDIVRKLGSIAGISENEDWVSIEPDQNNDWLSLRNEASLSFMTMGDKKNKHNAAIFDNYSRGIATGRDAWIYNYSANNLRNNIESMIEFYNSEVERISALNIKITDDNIDNFINLDQTKIKWSRALKWDLAKNKKGKFADGNIVSMQYRPFTKQNLYFSRQFNEMVYQIPSIFPNSTLKNRVICMPGIGEFNGYSPIMSDQIVDLHFNRSCQCFPLKLYEKSEQGTLEGLLKDTGEIYQTRDGITNAGLRYFEDAYPKRAITKEAIFYYIYGLLHHPKFREIFKNNLSKELPRIPPVRKYDDFVAISQIGRKLGDLHVGYEQVKPYPVRTLVTSEQYFDFYTKTSDGHTMRITKGDYAYDHQIPNDRQRILDAEKFFRVEKMVYGKLGGGKKGKENNDRTRVIYNEHITLTDIPIDAYRYEVNGKPALDWVIERQAIDTDKDSGIVNDANLYAIETVGNPAYPLELFARVVTVSLETLSLVRQLPSLDIEMGDTSQSAELESADH